MYIYIWKLYNPKLRMIASISILHKIFQRIVSPFNLFLTDVFLHEISDRCPQNHIWTGFGVRTLNILSTPKHHFPNINFQLIDV